MKSTALGCLGWKPEDFERYWLSDLVQACTGHYTAIKSKQTYDKELARVVCYYSAGPHLKNFKYQDIVMPGDEIKPPVIGKMKKLTRAELKKRYLSSGLEISEDHLDKMFEKND